MPRSSDERLTNAVFKVVLLIFRLRLRRVTTYEERDQMLALYAPISLLMLPAVWLAVILFGYILMYWAIEPRPLYDVFSLSGSSLLTLGFTKSEGVLSLVLEFSEAVFGLTMAALLIAYLPTMYSAFSRREAMVAMLDVRAGTPPTPLELISRAHRIRGLDCADRIVGCVGGVVRRDRGEPHVAGGAGLLSFAAAECIVDHGGGEHSRYRRVHGVGGGHSQRSPSAVDDPRGLLGAATDRRVVPGRLRS